MTVIVLIACICMASVALEGGHCPYFGMVGGHVPLMPPCFLHLSIDVKVIEVKLNHGWHVQNVVVADHCGTTELGLWQDLVGKN